jgi:hypothetical protein
MGFAAATSRRGTSNSELPFRANAAQPTVIPAKIKTTSTTMRDRFQAVRFLANAFGNGGGNALPPTCGISPIGLDG